MGVSIRTRSRVTTAPLVALGAILGLSVSAGCASQAKPTVSAADRAACAAIQQHFYYPTVPIGGETVSIQAAIEVEALLKKAALPGLRNELEPLQRAIRTNSNAAMVAIFGRLQGGPCVPLVGPPPT